LSTEFYYGFTTSNFTASNKSDNVSTPTSMSYSSGSSADTVESTKEAAQSKLNEASNMAGEKMQQAKDMANDGLATAQQKASEVTNMVGEKVEQAKSAASNTLAAAQEKAGQVANAAGEKLEQGKEMLQSGVSTVQEKAVEVKDYVQGNTTSDATTTSPWLGAGDSSESPDSKFQDTRNALESMKVMSEERGMTESSPTLSATGATPEKLYDPMDFPTSTTTTSSPNGMDTVEATKDNVQSKLSDATNAAGEKMEQAKSTVGEKVEQAKSAASDTLATAQEKAGQVANAVGEKLEQGKEMVKDGVSTVQDKALEIKDNVQRSMTSDSTEPTSISAGGSSELPDSKFQATRNDLQSMKGMSEERGMTESSPTLSTSGATPEKLYDPMDFSTSTTTTSTTSITPVNAIAMEIEKQSGKDTVESTKDATQSQLNEATNLAGEKMAQAKDMANEGLATVQAKASEATSAAGETLQQAKSAVGEKVEQAKSAVSDSVAAVQDKAGQVASMAGEKVEQAKEMIQGGVSTVQDKALEIKDNMQSATTTSEPMTTSSATTTTSMSASGSSEFPECKFQATRNALESMKAMSEERGLTESTVSIKDGATPEKLYDPMDFSTTSTPMTHGTMNPVPPTIELTQDQGPSKIEQAKAMAGEGLATAQEKANQVASMAGEKLEQGKELVQEGVHKVQEKAVEIKDSVQGNNNADDSNLWLDEGETSELPDSKFQATRNALESMQAMSDERHMSENAPTVQSVLDMHAPATTKLFDPFANSSTTTTSNPQ
jgi:hypothetical protein